MLSKTIYTEADGTILIVFKNLAGLIHRNNGPAVIRQDHIIINTIRTGALIGPKKWHRSAGRNIKI
jgi:hypothetical protein